jgi:hypothetical protein
MIQCLTNIKIKTMTEMITESEWREIEKKYGKLFHYIAKGIFGDNAASSHEDSYNDVCMSAVKAVNGYAKKSGKTFKEFKNEDYFTAYMKTSIWNTQNTKRAYITPRKAIRAHELIVHSSSIELASSSSEDGESISPMNAIADSSCGSMEVYESIEFLATLPEEYKELIATIFKYPKSILDNGRANSEYISKKLNVHSTTIRRKLYELGKILELEI